VYVGRGTEIMKDDLPHIKARQFMDNLIQRSGELTSKDSDAEILTVDNHADGAYIYLKLKETDEKRAEQAKQLLIQNGGNSSGIGIGCVDFLGNVHPDQFWQQHTFGNVKERKFSEIWTDTKNPLLKALKNRKSYLKGKCGICRFLNICNGNLRVRAEAIYGDMWAPDPACYLNDNEIGLKE